MDSETITLTVNAGPTVVASSDTQICIGNSTPISASGATSYTWDNGLGSGAGQTVSPSATTTYTVTGLDGNGCSNTDQVTVTVNQLPAVNAGNDFSVCENSQTVLSGSGASSYTWDNGVTNGVSFTPAATTYTVTGTDANGCINTDQVTISLFSLPTVTIGTFSVDTLCTTDAAISLPVGTPAGGTYSGAGVSGSLYDPTLVLPSTHPVYYVYTDGNSCTNTAVTNITVVMCLGLFNNELVSYNVYPNPTGDILTIEFDKLVKARMVIVDEQGREVLKRSLNVEKTSVDVNAWTTGNYYVQIIDNNGQLVNTHKISVIH